MQDSRAGLGAALDVAAACPDAARALQAVTDEYGRAVGASAAMLAVGGWPGVPDGGTWIYESTFDGTDAFMLDGMVEQLREDAEPSLEPDTDFIWQSRRRNGSTCDFIGLRVRIAGLPRAAICAALMEPANPPDPLLDLTRQFASLAGLCLLGADSGPDRGRRPQGSLTSCLDQQEIKAALAAELSRCGLSRDAVALCFVTFADGEMAGDARVKRLMAVLGQVVAEAGQPYDFVGRLNANELLVVMPGADHEDGVATARHLMRVARLCLHATIGEHVPPVFHVADWDQSETAEELLTRGRTEAKRTGPSARTR